MQVYYSIAPAHWQDDQLVIENTGGYLDFCQACFTNTVSHNLWVEDTEYAGEHQPNVVIVHKVPTNLLDAVSCEGCGQPIYAVA